MNCKLVSYYSEGRKQEIIKRRSTTQSIVPSVFEDKRYVTMYVAQSIATFVIKNTSTHTSHTFYTAQPVVIWFLGGSRLL